MGNMLVLSTFQDNLRSDNGYLELRTQDLILAIKRSTKYFIYDFATRTKLKKTLSTYVVC